MKTAISMPDDFYRTAERYARQSHLTRSALFTRAVQEFLVHHKRDGVTERLNRVYGEEDSHVDPVVARLQALTMAKESW